MVVSLRWTFIFWFSAQIAVAVSNSGATGKFPSTDGTTSIHDNYGTETEDNGGSRENGYSRCIAMFAFLSTPRY